MGTEGKRLAKVKRKPAHAASGTAPPTRAASGKPAGTKALRRLFFWLILLVMFGFVASVGTLLWQRFTLTPTLTSSLASPSPAQTTQTPTSPEPEESSLGDVARLLEAYNKTNTTDLLSVFYTVVMTLAFTYGLTLFNKLQEKADKADAELDAFLNEKNLILNEIFFSTFSDRLSVIYGLVLSLSTLNANALSDRLSLIMQMLQDCRNKHFLIREVYRRGAVSQTFKSLFNDILSEIKKNLPPEKKPRPGKLLSPPDECDNAAIRSSIAICDEYLEVIDCLDTVKPFEPKPKNA